MRADTSQVERVRGEGNGIPGGAVDGWLDFRHRPTPAQLQYDVYIILRIEWAGFTDRLHMGYETEIWRIILRILA